MSDKVRILICDDHALFREGIKALLAHEPSFEVVGEATDGREAVTMAATLRPDIILMDIAMPDLSGYEATRRIKQANKAARVLILTMYDDEDIIARCLDAGASGYVLKDTPAMQLIYAIQTVRKGGKYLSPEVMKKVVNQYVSGAVRAETRYDRLSGREREILKLLADGLSVKEVASRLDLSVKTVDVHKYNLMRKLDIHDRAELIKYAIQNKLIGMPLADRAFTAGRRRKSGRFEPQRHKEHKEPQRKSSL